MDTSLWPADKVFDARAVPCSHKHGLIFARWHELKTGDHFILINDHRPTPLRAQFEQLAPDRFMWEELEMQDAFAVRISRLKPDPEGFSTAHIGGCGGTHAKPDGGHVLARIKIDTRAQSLPDAYDRIHRLGTRLQDGIELVARVSALEETGIARLTASGLTVLVHPPRMNGGELELVCRRDSPDRGED